MPNNKNNLVMVLIPVSTIVGIDIEWKKPKTFVSAAEEKRWMQKSRKEAMEIKMDLEIGRLTPQDLPGRLILKPRTAKLPKGEANRFKTELVEREAALYAERDLVNLFVRLVKFLRSWEPEQVHRILGHIKRMKLSRLMLLRNPDCVHKLRDLRDFGGDVEGFKEEDMAIREKATALYDHFKKVFNAEPGSDDEFFEDFLKQVDVFKSVTKDMKKIFCTTLSEKGYQRLLDTMDAAANSDNNE
ncbi:uncharacterized protein LOC108108670 [Drosophila eugracilis]|uniref:uncharacterized protein LOC108108670 n=1 Tax=Drosophila eugracilis TaxID=29029 RepID=UPI0007E73219|nr:uncharacterized protein LOC108108670 [Drosophila eugracilis]